MWVSIIGAQSTGKHVVGKMLEKVGYQNINCDIAIDKGMFFAFDHLVKMIAEAEEAKQWMWKKKIFTYRTIWDSFAVMGIKNETTSQLPQACVDSCRTTLYKTVSKIITPPNLVIYTRLSPQHIRDRARLTGSDINDNLIIKQLDAYEELLKNIRVPKIEVDMSTNPEQVYNEISYGVDSISSVRLDQHSIFDRSFFYQEL